MIFDDIHAAFAYAVGRGFNDIHVAWVGGLEGYIVEEIEPMEKNIFLINEYQLLAGRTINDKLTAEQKVHHALFEMCGELGEIHSVYQKEMQGHPIDEAHLKEEVGDLLWGIAELCTANGWRMSNILSGNIEKLKKRYPQGFDADRSVNREKYAEAAQDRTVSGPTEEE